MVNKAIVAALVMFAVSMGLSHAAYADNDDNGGPAFSFGFVAPPAYYPPPPPPVYYAPPPAYWGGNNQGDDDDQRDND